jgi:hypothetical protein
MVHSRTIAMIIAMAVGTGLVWLSLPGQCVAQNTTGEQYFAQHAQVVEFTFSGAHSAGPVTGTFTFDRVNGVLTDFDIVTPFLQYTPSNSVFYAVDEPSGFSLGLTALPVSNPPQFLSLNFAGNVETFMQGATIPRVDLLIDGQTNIAYFLTREQFQGADYPITGSAQVSSHQMTPFEYGIAIGCLGRSSIVGVCDASPYSGRFAAVNNHVNNLLNPPDVIGSIVNLGLGTPAFQVQETVNAIGYDYPGIALGGAGITSFGVTGAPAVAYAAGAGEFRDIITASAATFNGQPGSFSITYSLSGTISASNANAFGEVLTDVYYPDLSNLQTGAVPNLQQASTAFPSSVSGYFTVPKTFQFIYGQPYAQEFAVIAQAGTTAPNPSGRGFLWTSSTGVGSGDAGFQNSLVITGMEFFDASGNPLPSAPSIVSASGVKYSTDGTLLSFANFSAELEFEKSQGDFEVNESFTLGAGNNGINPPAEDVGLQIGTFSFVVPVGSFKTDSQGRYRFEGVANSTSLEIVIQPLGGANFKLHAEGHGAKVAGITSPVRVRLMIGDDGGTANAKLDD